jgi:hypothetical protein
MTITGIAYPLQIINGQLVTATDTELANDHINATIETETLERLGLPNFGLPDYTFNSYPNFLQVGSDVKNRLENWISECSFNVASNLDDTGIGTIEIFWKYKSEQKESITLSFN